MKVWPYKENNLVHRIFLVDHRILEIYVQCNRGCPRDDINYYGGQEDGLTIKGCSYIVLRITGLILEQTGFLSMDQGCYLNFWKCQNTKIH